jgi:predicted small secreted protein
MYIKKRAGLAITYSVLIAALVLAGCGTVKKATDGGSSGGNNVTSPPVVDCAWTTLNATGLSWGSNPFLDVVNNNLLLMYNYQRASWDPKFIVLQTLTGTTWSSPTSDINSNYPAMFDDYSCTINSNGSTYNARIDNTINYNPTVVINKDGVEVAHIASVYGDIYLYPSLQVVNGSIYIAYFKEQGAGYYTQGVFVKKITVNNSAAIDTFIPFGISGWGGGVALKVISDTEAYLVVISAYPQAAPVVMKWSAK